LQSEEDYDDKIPGLDNYDVALTYNMATCYQRLQMLEESADYLEKAIVLLEQKVQQLENIENQ